MKYLKRFQDHSDYAAYIVSSNFAAIQSEKDSVQYCKNQNEIHINTHIETPQYEYIDLGLPSGTLWAKYNVGANNETDYGNYYQYGKGTAQYLETYNDNIYNGNDNPLSISLDTAAQAWGGEWHMPTKTQLEELITNTTYEWTDINGVNGCKFIAQNGNYIFIPAAAGYNNGTISGEGNYAYIWSSTPLDNFAYVLFVVNGYKAVTSATRGYGYSIRPVIG